MRKLNTCKSSELATLCGFGIRAVQRLAQDGIVLPASKHGYVKLPESLRAIFAKASSAPDAIKTLSELKKLELECDLREEKLSHLLADNMNRRAFEQNMKLYSERVSKLHVVPLGKRLRKQFPDIDLEVMEWADDQLADIHRQASDPSMDGDLYAD